MIKVELEGFDEVQKMFERLGSTGERYFQQALTETAIEGTSGMKENCPVLTGRLRSSIHHESPKTKGYTYNSKAGSFNGKLGINLTGLSAAFGTNVDYAEYVNNRVAFFEKGERRALDVLEQRLTINYDKAIKELT